MQQRHAYRRRPAVTPFPSRERLPVALVRGCFLQGDQSIANQAGAAFRADLNTELQSIVRGSDGATAPATTYPYQIWNDTTTNLRKQRNAANTQWITRGTLAETRTFSRGSNTILGLADFGCFIRATAGFTQTLTAAATLGDGWMCFYRIDTGTVTFDPNASENIDGATTKVVVGPSSGILYCDGTGFYTIGFSSGSSSGVTQGTAQATTSGSTKDFNSIPAGTKRIVVSLDGVSTNGSSDFLIQIGDSGGIENTGYNAQACDGGTPVTSTAGFIITDSVSNTRTYYGTVILTLVDAATFTWAATGNIVADTGAAVAFYSAGGKSLSAELDRVRLTSVSADTFDGGKVNIQYES